MGHRSQAGGRLPAGKAKGHISTKTRRPAWSQSPDFFIRLTKIIFVSGRSCESCHNS